MTCEIDVGNYEIEEINYIFYWFESFVKLIHLYYSITKAPEPIFKKAGAISTRESQGDASYYLWILLSN